MNQNYSELLGLSDAVSVTLSGVNVLKFAEFSVMPAFIHKGPDWTCFALSRTPSQKSLLGFIAVFLAFVFISVLLSRQVEQLVGCGSLTENVARR